MARTLLAFENEMIDVMQVHRISQIELWNPEREDMDYCIVFNPNFPDNFYIKDLHFKFNTSELREAKIMELEEKLDSMEHVHLL